MTKRGDAWTEELRAAHLAALLARPRADARLDALAAPLLGDALLAAPALHDAPAHATRAAVVAARLAKADAARWAPASEAADRGSRDDVARAAERARQARVRRALDLVATDADLARDLGPALLPHADHLSALHVAATGLPHDVLDAHRPDAARVARAPSLLERAWIRGRAAVAR